MTKDYQNEKEIEAVVQGFERCTTGKGDFKHREHLTVAVWYLRHSDPEQALAQMRAGLLRFLGHHGIARAKYKEQLTVEWINMIQRTLDGVDADLSLLEVTNLVLDRLRDSCLVNERSEP